MTRRQSLAALGTLALAAASAARRFDRVVAAAAAAPPAESATVYPAVRWLVFVDDLHLQFRATGQHRDRLRVVIAQLLEDGDEIGLRSSGPSSIDVPPTSNRETLAQAVKSVTGNGLKLSDSIGDSAARELAYRAATSILAGRQALGTLTAVDDVRRAMLYFSDGYGAPSPRTGEDLVRFSDDARRGGVRVFPIEGPDMADRGVPEHTGERAFLEARRSVLRALASRTGGFVVLRDDDLAEALARINHLIRAAPLTGAVRR